MRKPKLSLLSEKSTLWATTEGDIIYVIDVEKGQVDYHPQLEGKRARRSGLYKFRNKLDLQRLAKRWTFVGYL